VPEGQNVVVELNADYLDHAFRETLVAWQTQHRGTGASVTLEEHGSTTFRDAADNTPQRQDPSEFPLPPRTSLQPLPLNGADQAKDYDGAEPRLRPILLGIDKYHRRHADKVRPLVQDLTESQNPDTLFVACVDSRVNPNLITSSGPGDLLTLRNIGNVVCSDEHDASIDAALSFAVNGLSVDSIVVCGHSNCGAMKAVIADAEGASHGALGGGFDAWLEHARPSYRELLGGHPVALAAEAQGYSRLDQLSMVNVALQLRKLERHPVTGPAMASGHVQTTGLFYDIPTARVVLVTPEGIKQLDSSMAVR
jgi:carbonic anhydrase